MGKTNRSVNSNLNHPGNLLTNRSGFTLIEMAIVIIVVGIIISIVASVLPSLIASSKIRQARAMLQRADNALQGYSIANLRLPFADSDGDGRENTGTFVGSLPYLDLGLSSANDVWGNPIRYAVYGGGTTSTFDLTQIFANVQAFCIEITNASTAAFDNTVVHTTTADPCGGADDTNSANHAYVLISGGLKDLDGANGYLDDCNGQAGSGFNIPGKIQDTTYDDLVRAYSLNELNQQICSGISNNPGATVENPAAGNCNDGMDNDSDGDTDCDDTDCSTDPACTGGASPVDITTTTIPSGVINSSYITGFAANGGTTPYTWSILNNGGFSDFSINPSTGTLSGTLNQCPSTYTISVQVQDSTLPGDGGPYTDSESFSLDVTSDLAVARTSGSGSSITWSSSSQQETFIANGGRLGTINWSLNSGGATGFAVTSTGANTGTISKTGSTAPSTYTFTLTATDATCAANTDDLVLTVTVTASGGGSPGNLTGVEDTEVFYAQNMSDTDIIHTSGDYFAIAFEDNSSRGRITTVSIDSSGTIAYEDSNQISSSQGEAPDIIHINGDIYAVAYEGSSHDGWLRAMDIDSSGNVSQTSNSVEFETSQGEQTKIVHVTGNIYAITYRGRSGGSNDGWIDTVTIQASGAMSGPIDRYEFDTSEGEESSIVHVSGDVFAIAYSGPGEDGWVTTVTIDSSGDIAGTGQSLEFDGSYGREPVIVNVGNDIFAIAYRGPGDDGWIKTVTIDAAGTITGPADDLEFDDAYGEDPDLIQLSGDVYAVAYEGPDSDGWIKTLTIDSAGQILATSSSLEFDTDRCNEPRLIKISNTLLAVAYEGPGNDGYIKTISFE